MATGYGPRTSRPVFNGKEDGYELWEIKFLGYMRLQKLVNTILPADSGGVAAENLDAGKNAEAFAELTLCLDDKSLTLIFRDAKDDGRKALSILRGHYLSSSETRVIGLYTELTSLKKEDGEDLTDYMLRAETAAAMLKQAGETVSDNLVVAMILKGLPSEYQPFVTVTAQRREPHTLTSFKQALRTHEETMKVCEKDNNTDNVMFMGSQKIRCYGCGQLGHKRNECRNAKQSSTSNIGSGPQQYRKWCVHCKSKTHYTSQCRRKTNMDAAKTCEDQEHTYLFKVTVETVDPKYSDTVNSLLVDTGATTHILNDENLFSSFDSSFEPDKHFIVLADGSYVNGLAQGKGRARVQVVDSSGHINDAVLENALFVPSFRQSIFSVQSATQRGSTVEFRKNDGLLKCKDGTTFNIVKKGQLYFLNSVHMSKCATRPLQQWHEIMGHCNVKDVLQLERASEGMKISDTEMTDCETCIKSKMINQRSRLPDEKATQPFEFVHCDLSGPVSPTAKEGYKYAICFVDDYSGLTTIYFLKGKDDAVRATKKFLADIAPYGEVKRMRTDNGGEFICKEFRDLMVEKQIKHEMSSPESPHQNGTVERHWRSIFDMGRCMLLESGLPKYLWTYAVMNASYVRNRCFNPRIKMTPYEAVTGLKPNISSMHKFGSPCFAYVTQHKKLDARAEQCVFVGHDRESPAYLVYYPDENKIRRVRIVRFTDKPVTKVHKPEMYVEIPSKNVNDQQQVNVSSSDEHENASGGTPPTEDKGEVKPVLPGPKLGDSSISDSSQDRYPKRENRGIPPQRFEDYVHKSECGFTVDYCYRVGFVPETYEEAMQCENTDEWSKAMDDEIGSLIENKTFEVMELPENKKAIKGKWVYASKMDANGETKCKARYVAKGFTQQSGIDYEETFSPTANMSSLRMLMQASVDQDLIVHQLDVKTAYLNAPLDFEIYMEQPKGYSEINEGSHLVWRLHKSLYGLKQSGRNWNFVLKEHLTENGFVQSESDSCLFVCHRPEGVVYVLFWVDDIMVAASTEDLLEETKKRFASRFKMRDLGPLKWFLAIEFEKSEKCIRVSQRRYFEKILTKFNMQNCKPRTKPCDNGLDKDVDESPLLDDPEQYREIVGSLIYAMCCTRPDLSYTVTKLAQKMSKPTKQDLTVAKDVLRYIKGTIHYGLSFVKSDETSTVLGFCDADWASSSDRHSISGYIFQMNATGGYVSWKSKKQRTVALSTCEAEYMALALCVQEAIHLIRLYSDLYSQSCLPVEIGVDNQGTILLAKNPVMHQRTKHIDVKYHFVREEVEQGNISLFYIPSARNVADVFTKPQSRSRIHQLINLNNCEN